MSCPIDIEISVNGVESTELDVQSENENIILEILDSPCNSARDVPISEAPDNRLERNPDGLYVRDRLDPDPVAYYLLSRG